MKTKHMNADKNKQKGKILRCKQGYNPNSSSVGSHLPYFFAISIGSGLLSVFIYNFLDAADSLLKNKLKPDSKLSNSKVTK